MSKPLRLLLALLAALALVAAACGDDDDGGDGDTSGNAAQDDGGDDPPIVIGAQDFGESAILAEIYKQRLEDEGYEVSIQSLGGFRDIEIEGFDQGEINFAPEYAASMLEFLNEGAGEATGDVDETVEKLQTYLDEKGLTALEPTDAVDTNAFVVTDETAESVGLQSLSDLAEKGADLTLGGPADCETNAFCIPGLRDTYGLDLSGNFTALDADAVADTLAADQVDVGILFSSSGRIADEGWVLLEDDQQMLAADNVVPVVKDELTEAYGDELAGTVDEVSAALTTEELTELNKRYEIDKEDAADVAASWLEDNDLAG
ncbi:MAG TPA: ABC transporter substrate-binding protein [Acidimicrobiales bacterium]|nr:ABC transporter substrate-binding protein [Acidimicrobiales bacterium]